jgi:hypothetical protein
MLRAARDIEAAAPGTVAFVNFEADFDKPVVLRPTNMDRSTWERALSVALSDLASLVAPKRVVVCEGGSAQRFGEDGIDGEIYNRVFASMEPDAKFFSSGSHSDTEKARASLAALFATVLPAMEVRRLIDRGGLALPPGPMVVTCHSPAWRTIGSSASAATVSSSDPAASIGNRCIRKTPDVQFQDRRAAAINSPRH